MILSKRELKNMKRQTRTIFTVTAVVAAASALLGLAVLASGGDTYKPAVKGEKYTVAVCKYRTVKNACAAWEQRTVTQN